MIDEHGKAVIFLSPGEKALFSRKGPFLERIICQLHFMLVLLQVVFYVKVALHRS